MSNQPWAAMDRNRLEWHGNRLGPDGPVDAHVLVQTLFWRKDFAMGGKKTSVERRKFLQIAGGAIASAFWAMPRATLSAPQGGPRPNFLIFYTDDQGWGDMGCYGASELRTPNMDALAASGARFTSWYSNSPVCSPSRASLLTGRYPRRAGVPQILSASRSAKGMPLEELTLAQALKALGYRTALAGKWHLGAAAEYRPTRRGFDEFFGHLGGCIDYYSHIYYWGQGRGRVPHHDLWRNEREVWHNGEYMTELITREARRFIRDNRSRPFFLYVAYNAPHYPMHAPRRYFERVAHIRDPQRRTQAAMLAAVDDGIGEIMNELRQAGLLERTVVFFQSDNGPSAEPRNLLDDSGQTYHGGSAGPFRGHKASLFEGGIRVPALLSWPGKIPPGQVIDEIGMAMDIFPTFIKLAGGSLPNDRVIDGKDILPMVTRGAPSPHDAVFWAYGRQRAVRRGKWKLVLNPKLNFREKLDEKVFLADLESDPGETTNLADKHPSLVNELRRSIERWDKDVTTNR